MLYFTVDGCISYRLPNCVETKHIFRSVLCV